jgi:hypothetical protein
VTCLTVASEKRARTKTFSCIRSVLLQEEVVKDITEEDEFHSFSMKRSV